MVDRFFSNVKKPTSSTEDILATLDHNSHGNDRDDVSALSRTGNGILRQTSQEERSVQPSLRASPRQRRKLGDEEDQENYWRERAGWYDDDYRMNQYNQNAQNSKYNGADDDFLNNYAAGGSSSYSGGGGGSSSSGSSSFTFKNDGENHELWLNVLGVIFLIFAFGALISIAYAINRKMKQIGGGTGETTAEEIEDDEAPGTVSKSRSMRDRSRSKSRTRRSKSKSRARSRSRHRSSAPEDVDVDYDLMEDDDKGRVRRQKSSGRSRRSRSKSRTRSERDRDRHRDDRMSRSRSRGARRRDSRSDRLV